MPVHVVGTALPITNEEVDHLWLAAFKACHYKDEMVSITCISSEEMRTLNYTHRSKDRPTNVLTFSYGQLEGVTSIEENDHDVVICLQVAKEEAALRKAKYTDYVALLLAHAFLHVCGMDHEQSANEAAKTQQLEEHILRTAGFMPIHLS